MSLITELPADKCKQTGDKSAAKLTVKLFVFY